MINCLIRSQSAERWLAASLAEFIAAMIVNLIFPQTDFPVLFVTAGTFLFMVFIHRIDLENKEE